MKEYMKWESVYSFLINKVQLSSFINGLIRYNQYEAIAYLTEQLKSQPVDGEKNHDKVKRILKNFAVFSGDYEQEKIKDLIEWVKNI